VTPSVLMAVTPAVLMAVSVWFAVPPAAHRRAHSLWAPARPTRASPDPGWLAAACTPVAVVLFLGWPVGLVVGLIAAPVVRSAVGRLETGAARRRNLVARRQLPGALDLVTAALDAGRPPGTALALAAEVTADPLGSDLSSVAHRVSVAGDLNAALSDVDGPLLPLARALRRADQSGVPVADVITSAALDVRREDQAARRQQARQVGVRTAAPLGICFMPAFLLIGIVPTIIAVASNLRL